MSENFLMCFVLFYNFFFVLFKLLECKTKLTKLHLARNWIYDTNSLKESTVSQINEVKISHIHTHTHTFFLGVWEEDYNPWIASNG